MIDTLSPSPTSEIWQMNLKTALECISCWRRRHWPGGLSWSSALFSLPDMQQLECLSCLGSTSFKFLSEVDRYCEARSDRFIFTVHREEWKALKRKTLWRKQSQEQHCLGKERTKCLNNSQISIAEPARLWLGQNQRTYKLNQCILGEIEGESSQILCQDYQGPEKTTLQSFPRAFSHI